MTAGQSKPKTTLSNEALFSSLLAGTFFIVGVIGLLHHPLWRDEAYPWLVATANHSFRELYLVTRHDAHFMLWNWLLWILARFTHNCQAMQWLHLALATASVWLVMRFGPFTRMQKALYCCGYFAVFEYCLVCREYVCVVWLMFSLCALCDRRKDNFVLQAVILFLLSNIDVYATFIAFAFVAAWLLEQIHRRSLGELWAARKGALIGSGLILCTALLVDGLQLTTLPDALASTGWQHSIVAPDFAGALSNVWRGYVPIPIPFPRFFSVWRGSTAIPLSSGYLEKFVWGSNFLLDREAGTLTDGVILSLGLLVASTWTLRRSRMAMAWYLCGTCLMLWFQSMIASSALRHHGLYFILYVACLWSRSTWGPDTESSPATSAPRAPWERFFLPALLAVQAVAGVYVWSILYTTPFSSSKLAADFIRRHGYGNLLIIGSREFNVSPLAAYLGKPIYYPDSARFGTFPVGINTGRDVPADVLFRRIAQMVQKRHTDALFVYSGFMTVDGKPSTSARLNPDGSPCSLSPSAATPYLQVSLLTQFRATVDEEYSLYLIQQR